jgi:DNA-binding CsgD family transcriptional regulator
MAWIIVRQAVFDPTHVLPAIAARYGLSRAESRVVAAITETGGVPQAARALGLSETTVKTHLQRAFRKTGTARQVDLVKLVAGFVSPLA